MIGIESLTQRFFNDLLRYMVKEPKYFHSTGKKDPNIVNLPEIGLSNETIIKRITDLIEYLTYCNRRKGLLIDLDEVREYVKIAKHRGEP